MSEAGVISQAMMLVPLYLFVLSGDYLYTWLLIKREKVDLSMGPLRTPPHILFGSLALKGFSLTAFFWTNYGWVYFHLVWHLALALKEAYLTRRRRPRWVFVVNHLCFLYILWLLLGTLQ